MSFLGLGKSNTSESPAAVIPPEQQQIIDSIKKQITEEIATNYATTLVNALSENCFEKCIKSQTSSLTGEQEKCIEDCSSKFMRSWNVISKSYVTRINQK